MDRLPVFLEATRTQGALAYPLTLASLSWGFRVSELFAITVGHICASERPRPLFAQMAKQSDG